MASLTRRLGGPAVATGLALALGIIPAQAASAGGWQRVYRNSARTQNILYSVAALSGSDQWAVGVWGNSALVMHGNGSRWREFVAPAGLPAGDGLVPDGRGGAWAGALAHWTGRTWVNTEPGLAFTGTDAFAMNGLARVPGRSTLWAVGEVSRTPTSPVWDTLIARYP